jgi:hypothetical protein
MPCNYGEGASERGANRLAAHVSAKIAGHRRVAVTDWTAAFEQRARGIEKNRLQHCLIPGPRSSQHHEAAHQRTDAPDYEGPSMANLARVNPHRLAGER